jgi:hypothetical protein
VGVARVTLVIDHAVRGLCQKAYPNHPKGCPNFKKCSRCPPKAPLIGDVLDLSRPTWVVWSTFDLGRHVRDLRLKHPAWSDRQLRCCLYWQPRARAGLGKVITDFLVDHIGLHVLWTPEACGVDVTATMARAGEILEWPPRGTTYQVVVAGSWKEPPV